MDSLSVKGPVLALGQPNPGNLDLDNQQSPKLPPASVFLWFLFCLIPKNNKKHEQEVSRGDIELLRKRRLTPENEWGRGPGGVWLWTCLVVFCCVVGIGWRLR